MRTQYDASVDMETGASLSDLDENSARREAERNRRSEMAKKRRARIMAQMSKMQKEFIQVSIGHITLINESVTAKILLE